MACAHGKTEKLRGKYLGCEGCSDISQTRRGFITIEELREVLRYRNLIYQLVRRDIVARYKRSILGISWTMLNPLGMMIILSLVFSGMFHTVKGYPAYILSGLVV